MKKIIPFFLILNFLFVSATSSIQPDSAFFLGAIRSDGVLIPFALYDSGKWSSPWPGYFDPDFPDYYPKNLNDSTITTLSRIPAAWAGSQKKIPTHWWKAGTAVDSSQITITKPVMINSYCVELWALLISGRWPSSDPHRGVPYTGIATSVNLPVSPISTIHPDTPEWIELSSYIHSMMKKKEAESGPPLTENGYETIKMNMSIIRNEVPFHDEYYYYFEVEKLSYIHEADQNQYRCKSLSGEGWIRKNRTGELEIFGKEHLSVSEISIPDINSYMFRNNDIPMGIIILQDKMYWIIDDRGYEGESCEIYQIDQMGIIKVIDFYLGGC